MKNCMLVLVLFIALLLYSCRVSSDYYSEISISTGSLNREVLTKIIDNIVYEKSYKIIRKNYYEKGKKNKIVYSYVIKTEMNEIIISFWMNGKGITVIKQGVDNYPEDFVKLILNKLKKQGVDIKDIKTEKYQWCRPIFHG